MATARLTRAPHKSRLAAIFLVGVTASGALHGCAGDSEGSSSCPLILEYGGQRYHDAPADRSLPGTKRVGTSELPGCSNANDQAAESEQAEVWELKGVDPTAAVAAMLGGELQLFVAEDEADVCGIKYTRCHGEN